MKYYYYTEHLIFLSIIYFEKCAIIILILNLDEYLNKVYFQLMFILLNLEVGSEHLPSVIYTYIIACTH